MATINETLFGQIERIENAKADIKAAIEAKGVTVGDGSLDTYAGKIEQISGGSGGGSTIETGYASNQILNFYFVPVEELTETNESILIPNMKRSILKATILDINIHIDGYISGGCNIKIIRSQYIAETDTRTSDIKVELLNGEFGTIEISSSGYSLITNATTFTAPNGSAVLSGYSDIEANQVGIAINGLHDFAAFPVSIIHYTE